MKQHESLLRVKAVLVGMALLVAACGDEDGPSGPAAPVTAPTIQSFTATPTTVAATGDTVEFRWRTTDATSLAIEPGIGSVTPTDSGSVRRFVSATTTFTLTATNGAGSASADATVTAASSTITVTGTVIGQFTGPLPNVPVIISGHPSTTTDASGNFTVSGVAMPYEATVVATASKRAMVYKGLTRPDPILYSVDLSLAMFPYSATLSGTISGGTGFPQPANHRTAVAFASDEAGGTNTANGATGAYSLGLGWAGPVTTTGTIHGLQWEEASTLPVTYKGYGTNAGVALADGGVFTGQNITMSSIPTATLSGTVIVPSGYSLGIKIVSAVFGRAGSIDVVADGSSTASFSYATPSIPGVSLGLRVIASSSTGNTNIWRVGLDPSASGLTITIPVAPSQTLPVNAATNVDTTTVFSWTGFNQGVHLVYFNGPLGEPDYYVVTGATSTTIPNLNTIGLGLPASTAYQWQIRGVAPFASVDDAAGPGGFYPPPGTNPASDGALGQSSTRDFTTKP